MDTIRTQAGMLSMITSQTDEITRDSEVFMIKLNKINFLIDFLKYF